MNFRHIKFNIFNRAIRIDFFKAPMKEELDECMKVHLDNMVNENHPSDKYLWFYKLPTIEKEHIKGVSIIVKILWLQYGIAIRIIRKP